MPLDSEFNSDSKNEKILFFIKMDLLQLFVWTAVLKADKVADDILQVSEFVKKTSSTSGNFALKVRFKSTVIVDFVLQMKREHGSLDLSKIYKNLDNDSVIYMIELTNKHTFDLFIKAKKIKKEKNWQGAIWLRDGIIFARANDDRQIKNILTVDDLDYLK